MKNHKSIYIILLFTLFVNLNWSCKQSEFDNNYYDPEKSVSATLEGLFTGFLYNSSYENRNTILPRYWNLATFQIPMPAKYAQVIGYTNSSGSYEQSTAYAQQRWEYFYNTYVAGYRSMEKKMAELSSDDQTAYQPFMEVAKILLYDQAAQMIDMWGDIPFHETGKIIIDNGKLQNAKYDSGEELYNFFIEDLKRISEYLNSLDFDNSKKTLFDINDIFFQGDINKWKMYSNSLRLRLAMRISYKDENKAKAAVQEILSNASTYPIVSTVAQNIFIKAEGDVLRSILHKHEGGIRGGLLGRSAPGKMINDIMAPAQDPRLHVLFSKNNKGNFVGVNEDWNENVQTDSIGKNYFSRIDSATFGRNDQFPGIIITAAEVSFLKAEALERWGIGTGTAKDSYENGIKQSIEFYYNINAMNQNSDGTSYTPKAKPTAAQINSYVTNSKINYSGSLQDKLEKIATQQWINFGVIQAYHAWAEVRRTGYPILNFKEDASSPNSKKPPLRLLYPDSERQLNKDNYSAVAGNDKVDIKVFWHVK